MATRIKVLGGQEATLVDGRWFTDVRSTQDYLNVLEGLHRQVDTEYEPDPDYGSAMAIIRRLGGELLETDPVDNSDEADDHRIY